ncbi:C40 family peptidase [Nocardia sp. NPDC001965]
MADTEAMVQAALSKQGSPYVWGATGPMSFDCSGLVQWAAREAGIKMSRTTYTQVLEGEPVVGAPQRGDLVFPDAGHVGIALGGNQMVHAPETGDVVKVSNYWTTPVAVRRIGANSGTPGDTAVDPKYQSRGGMPSLGDLLPDGIPNPLDLTDDVANLKKAVSFQLGLLKKLSGGIKAVGMFLSLLSESDGWERILKVAVGTLFCFIGIGYIARDFVWRMI